MSITGALDGAQAGVPLRFTPPGQLVKMPLDATPDERMNQTYREAAAVLSEATPEKLANLVLMQEISMSALLRDGAVYAATCVARSEAEPATLCTAQFVVLVQEAYLPQENPLSTLASGLQEPGVPRKTAIVEYHAGSAVLVGEERSVTPSRLASGRKNTETYRMRQAQVIIPFPGYRRLALMSVSSQHLQDWEHFTRMLDDMAESIRFDDGTEPSIEDRLNPGNW